MGNLVFSQAYYSFDIENIVLKVGKHCSELNV